MSGGGDPWLLGLNRPKWTIRGRASLPACRYRGLWIRRFVRPIGAAGDTRHSAPFVGNMRRAILTCLEVLTVSLTTKMFQREVISTSCICSETGQLAIFTQ